LTFHHPSAEESRYNMLEHTTDKIPGSSVTSQPYSSLENSGSRNSIASSRKTSYSSLQSPGDNTVDEVYEYPTDQDPGDEEYGRLNHSNRYPPELPQRRKTSEYGTLNHSGELRPGASTQQNQQYGKLDHSISTPEFPQRRTISEASEYGKLEHSVHRKTSNTIVGSADLQENEYGKLECTPEHPQNRISSQENEYGKLQNCSHNPLYEIPIGLQQNEYGRLNHNDHHIPKLPPRGNNPSQEYEFFVPQSNSQENDYGKLDHTGHTPKLEHSDEQGTSSSSQHNYHSEYNKIGTESSAVCQNKSDHLDQASTSGQHYSHLSHSSVPHQNEPGRWAQTQGSSSEQHLNVPRKLAALKSVPSVYQGQNSENNGSNDETHYMQPRKTDEFSFSSQNNDVPSGYESFRRVYGTSISAAINSYSSDPEDDITDHSEVVHSGDDEYSMLSPPVADGIDKPPVGQSNNAASDGKPKTHAKQKPTPKPRHT